MKYDYMSGGAYVPTGAAAIQLSKALIAAKEAKKDENEEETYMCGQICSCAPTPEQKARGMWYVGECTKPSGHVKTGDKVHSASGHCEWTETS